LGALTTARARGESSGCVGGGLFETREVVVEIVTVVKFGVNDGSGNGGSCFGIEVRADITKLTNIMIIAGFGER